MFSFLTMNWRGRPLASYRTVIELIGATTTRTGLKIKAERDTEWYTTGVKISDADMAAHPSPHTTSTGLELHPRRPIKPAVSPKCQLAPYQRGPAPTPNRPASRRTTKLP